MNVENKPKQPKIYTSSILNILLIVIILITGGCSSWFDDTAPTLPDDPRLSRESITMGPTDALRFDWTEATDDVSDKTDLEYNLYYSNGSSLSTLDEIDNNGTSLTDWMTDTTFVVVEQTLVDGDYFNLLVRDEAGNEAIYTQSTYGMVTIDDIDASSTGDQVFTVNSDGETYFSTSINLGSTARDYYFVLTNSSTSDVTLPEVEDISSSSFSSIRSLSTSFERSDDLTDLPRGRKDRPDLMDWEAPELTVSRSLSSSVSEPNFDSVGTSTSSFEAGETDTVDSTCRKVVEDITTDFGVKTLNIWVADDCWDDDDVLLDGDRTYLVNQTMVDEMANAFLLDGLDNDIYDYVTGIYGEEWGTHDYSGSLISESDEITILLYDISEDDDGFLTSGYTLGYFWSKDNYTVESYSSSNERIMFYMDAPVYAYPGSDDVWNITDTHPQDQISTLAHEFQHMIHYYQKTVLLAGQNSSDTWLNEMCSLTTEDLVSTLMGVNGPRGVDYTDGTAGSVGNSDFGGRLPYFNYYNDDSLTNWREPTDVYVFIDYSPAYAFGAFLARNYGGAELFQNIVQSAYTDEEAVEQAIYNTTGETVTFEDLLVNWGVGGLLSDTTSGTSIIDRQYNSGSWFEDSWDGIDYDLGSINLWNYDIDTLSGPLLYYVSTFETDYTSFNPSTMAASSNVYLYGGNDSGTVQHEFNLPEDEYGTSEVTLTLVVRD